MLAVELELWLTDSVLVSVSLSLNSVSKSPTPHKIHQLIYNLIFKKKKSGGKNKLYFAYLISYFLSFINKDLIESKKCWRIYA